MKDFHLLVTVIGIGLGIAILYLVRRDHLYIRQGLFWIIVALASLILGIWPPIVDWVGSLVGVYYPPALLFLIAIVVLMVRSLLTDIALTQVRRDLRRVNQRIALAESEAEVTENNAAKGNIH
ncbi:MAG: DUF2304 domain-containing protein [Hydrogenophilales bacterium CG_4_8_14_3_um_filter_62_83]|nr:MAG: DUF2304 domain-containing protein [Hydrogenophilales bacterium CG15_BIG_FIL_POST_REV_8_21_14_020_62_31]PIW72242.1 MAG: DUF2304 domain-containing protein [Hydrogenophilales bacterium CG12_big_fil_rev_8_21_14_0_65_61_21]PIX01050.1 MAG: DUF2304 domain-containing protein [Hydrogenophilales bacterium CG_4_8_14_3_um_filter_62_83]PIY99519.1 MAG: DUF2304 domain-containing protein [Hydrogenophilales bacterium CG_4_10_14_0_8_um_filter_62_70]